ncbi:hypothetical protein RM697_02325 [Ichthyenterobacterium sp. W332]|uniref:Lipoprotein n=1 Tax=Microcosmobacter mediterraneus TaxID=3075607 RepID=A0ABU2YH10_9FLAO|nr:hypothetical protein [Ichthyenterobacterium sp. W332]MDT0557466.1 hypothetical protein [Ichthyenterobacterium sp. W332]
MKTSKCIIIVLILLLMQSCIMKSLNPFYKKESIVYNASLIGEWKDSKKGKWQIASFKEEFEKENSGQEYLNNEDKESLEKYKDGYIISYTKSDKEAIFIAVPFKVNEQLYIDFTPFYYEDDDLNNLLSQHLLKTHSVAKLIVNTSEISFSFLSEEVMKDIFKENKIRLNHTNTGIDDNLLLTANSSELHNFLTKFDKLDIENKWRSSDVFNLKKINVQP